MSKRERGEEGIAGAARKNVQEKTAIIVGASRGLGLGLAGELAGRGWRVTATARDPGAATGLIDAAGASGGWMALEEVDIDKSESVEALAERLTGWRFDLVFINAGVYGPQHQSVDAATPEEVGALVFTNAVAPSGSRAGCCRSSPTAARWPSCPRARDRSPTTRRAGWTSTGRARPR